MFVTVVPCNVLILYSMIQLITWNVTGLMSSASYLCELLSSGNIDVCGLAEHWLMPHNSHFINCISTEYSAHTVCDKDLDYRSKIGKGGVAIMWKKTYDKHVVPVNVESDRVVGIQFEIAPMVYVYIFQIYLPCSTYPISLVKEHIDLLYDLYSIYSGKGPVIFMGDFNSSLMNNSPRTCDKLFMQLVSDCNLSAVYTLPLCHGVNNTFVSYGDRYTSMIDYICIPVEYVGLIEHCEIAEDACLNVSRHRPILCCLNLEDGPVQPKAKAAEGINWRKSNDQHKRMYQHRIEVDSKIYSLSDSDFLKGDIDDAYSKVCEMLVNSADKSFPKKQYKPYLKPFWNDILTSFHSDMKTARQA